MREPLRLRIVGKDMLTSSVCRFDLRDPAGRALPTFTPGAHIDVRTPNGAVRSYSLTGDAEDDDRYVIAVARVPDGRGGSTNLHDATAMGDQIDVASPVNTFELLPAARYTLIAGGIGITPIRAMFRALQRAGQSEVTMLYLTRAATETAFAAEFTPTEFTPTEFTAAGTAAHLHHSATAGRLDLWPWLAEPDDDTRVYCCGPTGLLDEVRALTMHWRPSRIHIEDFAGVSATSGTALPFRATWAPTGEQIDVPATTSLLDALRSRRLPVTASCESGTCGTCRLRLIDGAADHRDLVLDQAARASYIMPCVSRAASDSIVVGPGGQSWT